MSEIPKPALPRWQIILLLMLIATTFGSNHIAARIAFDHGVTVPTAVLVRSIGTALALYAAMRLFGIAFHLPRSSIGKAIVLGLMLTVQSYCLYSAVARIPVGLALLTFNSFPFVFAMLSWLVDRRRPSNRTLGWMALALSGLALALSPGLAPGARDLAQTTAGVAFALGASLSFSLMLLLAPRWLGNLDGRVRSFAMIATTAVVVLAAGLGADALRPPADGTGWLALAMLTMLYGTAYSTFFVVLPRFGILDNAGAMNFEPVAALLMGAAILGQAITPVQAMGVAVVLAAMFGFASGGGEKAK